MAYATAARATPCDRAISNCDNLHYLLQLINIFSFYTRKNSNTPIIKPEIIPKPKQKAYLVDQYLEIFNVVTVELVLRGINY